MFTPMPMCPVCRKPHMLMQEQGSEFGHRSEKRHRGRNFERCGTGAAISQNTQYSTCRSCLSCTDALPYCVTEHSFGSINKHEARGSVASLTCLSAGSDPLEYAGISALLFNASSRRCYVEVLEFGSPSGNCPHKRVSKPAIVTLVWAGAFLGGVLLASGICERTTQ
ncbi:hypothetical protein KL916_000146 [Ogataea parapolymorpha]|nr:hypothetical protein KL916_000146 [Ogataea parapolymorpha]